MSRQALLFLSVTILLSSLIPFTSSTPTIGKRTIPNSSITQADGNQTTTLIRIGCSNYMNPLTLNPFLDHKVMFLPIFDPLVIANESGLTEGIIARNWNQTEDRCLITIHDNITWHDGTFLNASDVKFTFDTILYSGELALYWQQLKDIMNGSISSVVIINSTTVSFQFLSACAPFLSWIDRVPIVPEHIFGTGINDTYYNNHPIGSGPFRFINWTMGDELNLVAYDAYCPSLGGRPQIDEVRFLWGLNRTEALINNEVDLIGGDSPLEFIDPNQISLIDSIAGTSTADFYDLAFREVCINVNNPYLNSTLVRQGLHYAIDKERIINELFGGYGFPAVSHIHPTLSWYNPDVEMYSYNLSRAEYVLDQAGFPRKPETGVRFSVVFKAGNYDPYRVHAAEIFAECLQDVGINTTIIWQSWAEWFNDFFSSNFELLGIPGWMVRPNPDVLLYEFYHSSGYCNRGGFNNSLIDTLLEQGRSTMEYTARKQIYDWVQGNASVEVPSFPLYFRVPKIAYNNDFWGFATSYFFSPYEGYSLKRVSYNETLSGEGKSPVKVCFIDPEDRRTGFFNGSILNEIPGSSYDEQNNLVKLSSPPEGVYEVEIVGTGIGWYSLEVVNIALDYKDVEIPEAYITEGEVHRYQVYVFDEEQHFSPENPTVVESGEAPETVPTTMVARRFGEPLISMYVGGSHVVVPAHGFSAGDYDTKHGSHYITR